jgi:transcription elongation factor GreB
MSPRSGGLTADARSRFRAHARASHAIVPCMSRAFVKEDSAGDGPIVVPPRAPLPEGAPNYVTPRGMALLRDELADLEVERSRALADRDVSERKRRLAVLSGRREDLASRISSARVIERESTPPEQVRFGVTVTVVGLSGPNEGRSRVFQIVGVDEADPARGRIGFASPLARSLFGLRVGDVASFRTGRGEDELEVTRIDYSEPSEGDSG